MKVVRIGTTALAGLALTALGMPGASAGSQSLITKVTIGRHAHFDRIVIRETGSTPKYKVHYVKQVIADGSGDPVTLRGRRFLEIRLTPATATDSAGDQRIKDVYTPLYPEIRQVKLAGDFEGYLTLALGLRHHRSVTVTQLMSPRRLVVDVQH